MIPRHLWTAGAAVAAAVAIGALMHARPASAGQQNGMTFRCGGNNCYGSLAAASRSPTWSDFVEFELDGGGTLKFKASSEGKPYACAFDQAASARLAPAALGGDYNLYFYILIDAAGRCLPSSYLKQSSAYQHLDRPSS
jgi:hypothetical protein